MSTDGESFIADLKYFNLEALKRDITKGIATSQHLESTDIMIDRLVYYKLAKHGKPKVKDISSNIYLYQ